MDSRTRWFYLAALVIVTGSIAAAAYKAHVPPEREGPDEWLGFVYPDRADLSRHEVIGAYHALDACLRAVRAETAPGARHEGGAYECGLNCHPDPHAPLVCERTIGNER